MALKQRGPMRSCNSSTHKLLCIPGFWSPGTLRSFSWRISFAGCPENPASHLLLAQSAQSCRQPPWQSQDVCPTLRWLPSVIKCPLFWSLRQFPQLLYSCKELLMASLVCWWYIIVWTEYLPHCWEWARRNKVSGITICLVGCSVSLTFQIAGRMLLAVLIASTARRSSVWADAFVQHQFE